MDCDLVGGGIDGTGGFAAQKNGTTVAAFGLNPSASESQLTCWLPEEWTQELVSLGWEDIPVWTQPADQVARMVEQHIAGERLAWYFFLAAIVACTRNPTLETMEQAVLLTSVHVVDPRALAQSSCGCPVARGTSGRHRPFLERT